jgi:anti-sigma B factor antagonist
VEIIEEIKDGVNIYRLIGRLDSNTSPRFEEKLFQAILEGSKSMVVDFKGIDYISSAGLRVILKAFKALDREDGQIMLCSMQDYVRQLFKVTGIDDFVPIVATLDDALQAF